MLFLKTLSSFIKKKKQIKHKKYIINLVPKNVTLCNLNLFLFNNIRLIYFLSQQQIPYYSFYFYRYVLYIYINISKNYLGLK